MSFKEKVFQIIDGGDLPKTKWNQRVETLIVVLIILSVIGIILESFEDIHKKYALYLKWLEWITVAIFSVEYLLRLWVADLKYSQLSGLNARFRFMLSTMGLIDLLAILPFYLPLFFTFDLRFIRILRTIRLLRILKMNRYSKAMRIVKAVVSDKQSELGITVFMTFILLLFSSTIMYHLENEAQPEAFPDIVSTFWWAVATLTTVGYGDVYPVTGWGKLVSGVIALLGVGLVALPTGIISAAFIEELDKEKSEKAKLETEEYKYCPHCGEKLS